MISLNFPKYNFKIKTTNKRTEIFDLVRKKYVALTPEEWVRQHTIQFLATQYDFPLSLMAVEKSIKLNSLTKRYDIVGYGSDGTPKLCIECKAPEIKITQKVFDQIARYNISLKVNYLMVTNGLDHYFCYIDFKKRSFYFLESLPSYKEL